MKLNTNKHLFVFLAGFLLLLYSCNKEEIEQNDLTKKAYTLKVQSFQEISKTPKFNKAFQYFNSKIEKTKFSSKSTPIKDIDFKIDSSTVKEINIDNITTYTMAIYRKEVNANFFENLVVKVDQSDSIKAYIVKYFPTKEITYNNEHKSFSFTGYSEMNEIQYDSSIFTPTLVADSECSMTLMCDWEGSEHSAGSKCCQTYWVINCGGSGGNSTGGSSTGSTGSTSGGTSSGYTGSSGPSGGGNSSSSGSTTTTTTVPTATVPPSITTILGLNSDQIEWLYENPTIKTAIEKYVIDSYYSVEAKEFAKQLIDYCIVNPDTTLEDYFPVSPNFKMKIKDQLKYPKFTKMVKDLKMFVQQNPDILNTLSRLSGLTETQILEKLTFGNGPLLNMVPNLTSLNGVPNYGNFRNEQPEVININSNFAQGMENATLQGTVEATTFLMCITILHEFIHYGNFLTHYDTNGVEMGNLFEKYTFGVIVSKYNAGEIEIQFKNN